MKKYLSKNSNFYLMIYLVLSFAIGTNYCSHWYLNRKFMIIITSIVLVFPLCFSKTIKFLQIPR